MRRATRPGRPSDNRAAKPAAEVVGSAVEAVALEAVALAGVEVSEEAGDAVVVAAVLAVRVVDAADRAEGHRAVASLATIADATSRFVDRLPTRCKIRL